MTPLSNAIMRELTKRICKDYDRFRDALAQAREESKKAEQSGKGYKSSNYPPAKPGDNYLEPSQMEIVTPSLCRGTVLKSFREW